MSSKTSIAFSNNLLIYVRVCLYLTYNIHQILLMFQLSEFFILYPFPFTSSNSRFLKPGTLFHSSVYSLLQLDKLKKKNFLDHSLQSVLLTCANALVKILPPPITSNPQMPLSVLMNLPLSSFASSILPLHASTQAG